MDDSSEEEDSEDEEEVRKVSTKTCHRLLTSR